MRPALALLLVAPALFACASSPGPNPTTPGEAAPIEGLPALEQRLAQAPVFQVRARTATSGRIVARFEGALTAAPGNKMRIETVGSFGNRDVEARLLSDGIHMRGGSAQATFDLETPPGLRDGVVVSFVRMGLTHQLVRLSTGKPPEYLDGHARLHLRPIEVWHEAGERVRDRPTERWQWVLLVDDKRAAEVKLWLDAATGLPVQRRMTVHFDEGDMDVAEDYDAFTIGDRVDDTFK